MQETICQIDTLSIETRENRLFQAKRRPTEKNGARKSLVSIYQPDSKILTFETEEKTEKKAAQNAFIHPIRAKNAQKEGKTYTENRQNIHAFDENHSMLYRRKQDVNDRKKHCFPPGKAIFALLSFYLGRNDRRCGIQKMRKRRH